MPRQNRVVPTGEIIAHPARGRFMGNRGILHDASGRLGRSRWKLYGWVTCVLDFKGRHRAVMSPGTYTELFFHDEAVALAAGHRPCAECRRTRYRAYRDAAGLPGLAPEFDRVLHAQRILPGTRSQRRHCASIADLPDGTFIWHNGPCLLSGDTLLPFSPAGYGPPIPRPRSGTVDVLTPELSVTALRNGYRPDIGAT